MLLTGQTSCEVFDDLLRERGKGRLEPQDSQPAHKSVLRCFVARVMPTRLVVSVAFLDRRFEDAPRVEREPCQLSTNTWRSLAVETEALAS